MRMNRNFHFAGVSPVIAVILMVAITVVLAGAVFLWVQNFSNDSGGDVDTVVVRCSLDAGSDELNIEVISDHFKWGEYKVTVEDTEFTTSEISSNAGDTAVFADPLTATDITIGTDYTVKIVDIADNELVWEGEVRPDA